jgi:hypothetical protein
MLSLDMPLRLEPIDAQTPDRAALVHGPVALFQTGAERASLTRAELLAAKAVGDGSWRVGGKPFRPFTAIAEGEPTRLYQIVTASVERGGLNLAGPRRRPGTSIGCSQDDGNVRDSSDRG